jgi:Ribbon-helix-helix protein, copG family
MTSMGIVVCNRQLRFPWPLRWRLHLRSLMSAPQCYTLVYVRKKLTAIRLKPEQIKKLERIAVREDVPVSWLIRRAIDEFLKRRK